MNPFDYSNNQLVSPGVVTQGNNTHGDHTYSNQFTPSYQYNFPSGFQSPKVLDSAIHNGKQFSPFFSMSPSIEREKPPKVSAQIADKILHATGTAPETSNAHIHANSHVHHSSMSQNIIQSNVSSNQNSAPLNSNNAPQYQNNPAYQNNVPSSAYQNNPIYQNSSSAQAYQNNSQVKSVTFSPFTHTDKAAAATLSMISRV